MIGRQAKIFSPGDLQLLLTVAHDGRFPERNRLMILLTVRAALRACEIANLTWEMVQDASGRISQTIEVRDSIAKRGSGRRVPMHPEIKKALLALRRRSRANDLKPGAPILRSQKGGSLRANSVVNWFVAACRQAKLGGCSSHSGRRTFITNTARVAHRVGASLRDVQLLAGHRSIETTQGYIDGDSNAQRRLVSLLH